MVTFLCFYLSLFPWILFLFKYTWHDESTRYQGMKEDLRASWYQPLLPVTQPLKKWPHHGFTPTNNSFSTAAQSEMSAVSSLLLMDRERKTGRSWFVNFVRQASNQWTSGHGANRIEPRPTVAKSDIRDFKMRGRRRQRKRHWKSEFAFFQSSSRLLLVTTFVKCGWTLLKLNF